MADLSKRLQRSASRIAACGGVVVLHFAGTGALHYQTLNGRAVSSNVVRSLIDAGVLIPSGDELFRGMGRDQSYRLA